MPNLVRSWVLILNASIAVVIGRSCIYIYLTWYSLFYILYAHRHVLTKSGALGVILKSSNWPIALSRPRILCTDHARLPGSEPISTSSLLDGSSDDRLQTSLNGPIEELKARDLTTNCTSKMGGHDESFEMPRSKSVSPLFRDAARRKGEGVPHPLTSNPQRRPARRCAMRNCPSRTETAAPTS